MTAQADMRLIDVVKAMLSRPVAFHAVLARLCGSASAGLMLSQALYWTDVQERTNQAAAGWFYKTSDEWETEICLSRHEQEGARRILRGTGCWFEQRKGIGAFLHFRVDLQALAEVIAQKAERQQTRITKSQIHENRESLYRTETTQRVQAESTGEDAAQAPLSPDDYLDIDGTPFTPQEIAHLDAAYAGWLADLEEMAGSNPYYATVLANAKKQQPQSRAAHE